MGGTGHADVHRAGGIQHNDDIGTLLNRDSGSAQLNLADTGILEINARTGLIDDYRTLIGVVRVIVKDTGSHIQSKAVICTDAAIAHHQVAVGSCYGSIDGFAVGGAEHTHSDRNILGGSICILDGQIGSGGGSAAAELGHRCLARADGEGFHAHDGKRELHRDLLFNASAVDGNQSGINTHITCRNGCNLTIVYCSNGLIRGFPDDFVFVGSRTILRNGRLEGHHIIDVQRIIIAVKGHGGIPGGNHLIEMPCAVVGDVAVQSPGSCDGSIAAIQSVQSYTVAVVPNGEGFVVLGVQINNGLAVIAFITQCGRGKAAVITGQQEEVIRSPGIAVFQIGAVIGPGMAGGCNGFVLQHKATALTVGANLIGQHPAFCLYRNHIGHIRLQVADALGPCICTFRHGNTIGGAGHSGLHRNGIADGHRISQLMTVDSSQLSSNGYSSGLQGMNITIINSRNRIVR